MFIEHKFPHSYDTIRVTDDSKNCGQPFLIIHLYNEHYEEKTIENCVICLENEEIEQLMKICIEALKHKD